MSTTAAAKPGHSTNQVPYVRRISVNGHSSRAERDLIPIRLLGPKVISRTRSKAYVLAKMTSGNEIGDRLVDEIYEIRGIHVRWIRSDPQLEDGQIRRSEERHVGTHLRAAQEARLSN